MGRGWGSRYLCDALGGHFSGRWVVVLEVVMWLFLVESLLGGTSLDGALCRKEIRLSGTSMSLSSSVFSVVSLVV